MSDGKQLDVSTDEMKIIDGMNVYQDEETALPRSASPTRIKRKRTPIQTLYFLKIKYALIIEHS